ncbi:hypothetical protein IMZ48_16730, partial [Candidatus Bathyarchaeota archaeon]|nr:hypothetical protein [Candidatus Bathyarchaeota archaeon]
MLLLTMFRSALDDKTCHQILESVFNGSVAENAVCLGGSKSAASTAATRLSKCAKVVRLVIEQGTGKLKRKTALAVADHITQILPGPDEELIQPLTEGYIKALRALLSRPANVEQLAKGSAEGWLVCVKFCADVVASYVSNADEDASLLARASPAPGTPQALSLTRSSGRSNASSQRPQGYITQSTLLDLLECLHYLVLTPHSPLRQVAARISRPVMRILQIRQFSLGRIQQFSFATIVTILSRLTVDDMSQARTLARGLVPLITHWWHARGVAKDEMLKSIRDEMLRAIFAMCLHLEHLAKDCPDDRLRKDLEDLLDVLWSEYARRDPPDQLRIDDLNFSSVLVPDNYFRTSIFSLHPHNREGERKWGVLQSIALLEDILFKANRADGAPAGADEQPRKRRRTAREPNRLRQKLKLLDTGTQVTAVQLVPFLAQSKVLSDDDVQDLLGDLAALVTDKRETMASWAMLAAARYVRPRACRAPCV